MPLVTETSYERLRWSFEDIGIPSFSIQWIGLCTGAPGDSEVTTSNEVSDGWYGRRNLGTSYNTTPVSNGAVFQNTTQATWTPTTAVTITHVIMDDSSTVNSGHYWWAELNYPITTISSVPIYVRATVGLQIDLVTDFFCTGPTSVNTLSPFAPYGGGAQMWSSPSTNKYLGLSETVPNRDGGNITELSGSGYARITIDGDNFTTVSGGGPAYGLLGSVARTTSARIYSAATADWNTVNGWFISTLSSGGTASNIFACGALDSPVTVKSGETPRFNSSEFLVAVY